MVVMSVIPAQTEQLLAVETHRIGAPRIGQRIQLTVYSGQTDVLALILQPTMQILRGNEFVVVLQGFANGVLLSSLAHYMFTHRI